MGNLLESTFDLYRKHPASALASALASAYASAFASAFASASALSITFATQPKNNMSQDIITASDRAQPLGRYPHTRKVGPWIFISGTSSRRPDNSFIGATQNPDGSWSLDIAAQTRAVLENIRHYLQLNGADLHHLVDVTVFLKDMDDFKGYNEVYNSFFPEAGPCRTTIAAKDLPKPQILIEIKGTAYLSENK